MNLIIFEDPEWVLDQLMRMLVLAHPAPNANHV